MAGKNPQKQFQMDGYAILKNVIENKNIKKLHEAVVRLAKKYDPKFPTKFKSDNPWEDVDFNKRLLELRKNKPSHFGAIYDTMKQSLSIEQLLTSEKLSKAIEPYFGESSSGIIITGQVLRMDPPKDTRNALDWHQDSSYYLQNVKGENGLVVWIPMHDVDEKNGALIVCPGSHKLGRLDIKGSGKSNELTSEQYKTPDGLVKKFESFQTKLKKGDVLISNMDLFHRSGTNSSSKIRFAALVRFAKMLEPDFLPGNQVYLPSKSLGRLSGEK
jgi:ectoine hydroxylase-related dioxygenase (phytanoyl-CoA dioxygenase family)